jgi:hypothetical protein
LTDYERLPRIARLGRSGRELRHSFLLRSVERAEGAKDPWSIRQVAAYHSFDVETGRSVWITVKGNDLLQRRIIEDSDDLPVYQGAMGLDVGASFDASLVTHLIFFRWCEENWRWYVRDMEERIRGSLIRAKTIPVDSEPRFTTFSHKTGTGISASSRGSDVKPAWPTLAPLSEKRSVLQSIKELGRPRQTTFGLAPAAAETHELPLSQGRRVPEGMLVLNMFNYKDLQKLSILVERLEEATLVIQLNLDALRDIYEYYQHPIDFDGLKVDVRDHIQKSAASFRLKLGQIIRSMETRQTQLASLRKRLDNGKALVREGCPVGKGWLSKLPAWVR